MSLAHYLKKIDRNFTRYANKEGSLVFPFPGAAADHVSHVIFTSLTIALSLFSSRCPQFFFTLSLTPFLFSHRLPSAFNSLLLLLGIPGRNSQHLVTSRQKGQGRVFSCVVDERLHRILYFVDSHEITITI
jgi:hypothetical protein